MRLLLISALVLLCLEEGRSDQERLPPLLARGSATRQRRRVPPPPFIGDGARAPPPSFIGEGVPLWKPAFPASRKRPPKPPPPKPPHADDEDQELREFCSNELKVTMNHATTNASGAGGRIVFVLRGESFRDWGRQYTNTTCCEHAHTAQRAILESHEQLFSTFENLGYNVSIVAITWPCSNDQSYVNELYDWYGTRLVSLQATPDNATKWWEKPVTRNGLVDLDNFPERRSTQSHSQWDATSPVFNALAAHVEAQGVPDFVLIARWDQLANITPWGVHNCVLRPLPSRSGADQFQSIPGPFVRCFLRNALHQGAFPRWIAARCCMRIRELSVPRT